ncbi:ABC transporter permease [Nocardioides sp. cx-173]|uniref:ABC transporter permease n=1 Tax=Nocardioides sp. cx-173 TaxID=2898796 RepID=UPI001E38334B|nr:ABC transporter permease [Nocardioides sp. cx-173]MCD4526999.1 ABC transporter permease [Nocardioides sp. cx-173]UGB41066.1 ABC transporter permease [Nocardioides sp. cx-173]
MTAQRTSQDPERPGPATGAAPPSLAIDPRGSMIRAVAWVLGVLFLQFAFIFSYVAAFHDPTPHQLEVKVVAPPGGGSQAQQLVDELNRLSGDPLDASLADSESDAREDVRDGDEVAALVLRPDQSSDLLLVASGGGTSLEEAATEVLTKVVGEQQRTLEKEDLVPLQSGDARGLTGFYLVVGWAVGAYLFPTVVALARGDRPRSIRMAALRLAALVPYALASGFGGALIVGPLLDAQTGHLWQLGLLGTAVSFSIAALAIGLEALFGVIGIGVTLLLIVIIGNPSAGGAFQAGVMPTFWRVVGDWIPTGAGVDGVRQIVYFDSDAMTRPLLVLAAYAVAGIVLTLLVSGRGRRPELLMSA